MRCDGIAQHYRYGLRRVGFPVALLLHYAIPQGWYFDGTIHNWAPIWIPMTLGLSILLVGLIGLLKQMAHRRALPQVAARLPRA